MCCHCCQPHRAVLLPEALCRAASSSLLLLRPLADQRARALGGRFWLAGCLVCYRPLARTRPQLFHFAPFGASFFDSGCSPLSARVIRSTALAPKRCDPGLSSGSPGSGYLKAHRQRLTAIFLPKFPSLPAEIVSHIVSFGFNLGCYEFDAAPVIEPVAHRTRSKGG